jgi:hypothetical protein
MIWPASVGNIGSGQRDIIVKNNLTYNTTLIYPPDPAYSANFTFENNISGDSVVLNLTATRSRLDDNCLQGVFP